MVRTRLPLGDPEADVARRCAPAIAPFA